MCGIAGWVDWEEDLTHHGSTIDAMTATLHRRGPDARGTWLSRHAAFGHRRLVVIDPVGGAQPMTRTSEDGRSYTIVYNGELYNTAEVRSELKLKGHRFLTSSDTEVVLLAFVEWGPECVTRMNGIFAFGVWDEAGQRMYVARDRLGVKPLFYAVRGSALVFGSEPKALFANPLVEPEIDARGLTELLFLYPSRVPGSGIFRNVHELRAGTYLVYDRNGVCERRYWYLRSAEHTNSLSQTIDHVRWLLVDAVERQLVSDVSIGTLLSGGLDSSAISAIAADYYRRNGRELQPTWCVEYRDGARDFKATEFHPDIDRDFAMRVVDFLKLPRHRNVVVDTPALLDVRNIVSQARDLPGFADVDGSQFVLFRAVKEEATVILSGECSDEIFGGYSWYDANQAFSTFPWVRRVPERLGLLAPALRAQVHPEEFIAEEFRRSLSEISHLDGEAPVERRRRELIHMHLNWFMAYLLDRKDRMSMAASVEARVPFADHRIVEYLWNVPWAMMNLDGREKGLLRRALAGILPAPILERKKAAWPKTHDPTYHKIICAEVEQVLSDRQAPLHQLVDASAVRELIRRPMPSADIPWFGQLAATPQLLAFYRELDRWLRTHEVRIV